MEINKTASMFDIIPWEDNKALTATWLFSHDKQLYEFSRFYSQVNWSARHFGLHSISSMCEIIVSNTGLASNAVNIALEKDHLVGISSNGSILVAKEGYSQKASKRRTEQNLLVLRATSDSESLPTTLYYEAILVFCDQAEASDYVKKGKGLVITTMDWTTLQLKPSFIPITMTLDAHPMLWKKVNVIQQHITMLWEANHDQDILLNVWMPDWATDTFASQRPLDWILKQTKGLLAICFANHIQSINHYHLVDAISQLKPSPFDLSDAVNTIEKCWALVVNERLNPTKKSNVIYREKEYEVIDSPTIDSFFSADNKEGISIDISNPYYRKGLLMLVNKNNHPDLNDFTNRISYQSPQDGYIVHDDSSRFILSPVVDTVTVADVDYYMFELLPPNNKNQYVVLWMAKTIAITDMLFYKGT